MRSPCQPAAAQLGPQAVIRQDETERIGQRRGVQGSTSSAAAGPEPAEGSPATSGRLEVFEQITGVPHAIASSTGRPKPS